MVLLLFGDGKQVNNIIVILSLALMKDPITHSYQRQITLIFYHNISSSPWHMRSMLLKNIIPLCKPLTSWMSCQGPLKFYT